MNIEECKERIKSTRFYTRITQNLIHSILLLLLIMVTVWQHVRIDNLDRDIKEANNNIRVLASDLSYATSLAENANRYAHSHPFSDARLKIDIREIEDPLGKILALNGVNYYWNTEEYPLLGLNNSLQIGLIAQEVEKVFPELVTTDESGLKQVDYARLTAVLVEAMKEQQKEIDRLEEMIQ